MLIDWFTVSAQIINFVILIWLMKRFLYHPILNAIDAREKNIVLELKNADEKKVQAQNEHDEFQKKNDDFDQNRVALFNKMNEEVKVERLRQLEEVRKDANALQIKRQESLESNTENFYKNIKHKTEKEVFEITRKVITDLSTTNLEKSICQKFLIRLEDLATEEKNDFVSSTKTDCTFLRTSFNLADDQKISIQNSINESFITNIPLKFETTPEIIGGIELVANGKKISWSINDYLKSMEQSLLKSASPTDKDFNHEH